MSTNAVISIPIANGRQYEGVPAAIPNVGNSDVAGNLSKWTCKFNGGVVQSLHFVVPNFPNYDIAGQLLIVRISWRAITAVPVGKVAWRVRYGAYTATVFTPPIAASQYQSFGGVSGTSGFINETDLYINLPNADQVGALIPFTISRVGTSADDTLADTTPAAGGASVLDAEVVQIELEYQVLPTITKKYIWIPANAFAIPAASIAALTEFNLLSMDDNHAFALLMGNSASYYADARFMIPSVYNSAMKWTIYGAVLGGAAGSFASRLDMIDVAVGGASDPVLTNGNFVTIFAADPGPYSIAKSSPQAVPITPTASRELFMRLESRAGSSACYVFGVLIEFIATTKSPGRIQLAPRSGALPTAAPAVLTKVDDTNTSKDVAQYADNVDLKADYMAYVPDIYSAGGTLRVRWRTSAAAGNGYFRVDHGSPAVNSDSDPALTAGTKTAVANSGANLINEFTIDVSAGLVASDLLYVRVWRFGSDALDTLSASVDILEVVFEATVA
jgi:hypothetical protein